jgi:acylphosphatase
LHLLIRGHVQGVFFRTSVLEHARSLGLSGWVRNRSDGAVEVVAEGPADALTSLQTFCAKGPPGAVVRRVEVAQEPESGAFAGFAIRPEA